MRRFRLMIAGLLLAAASAGCYMQGLQDAPTAVVTLAVAPAGATAAPTVPSAMALASPTVLIPPNEYTPPALDTPPLAAVAGMMHTVQRGETLYRIAQFYGVPVDTLITANHLLAPDRILVGQALVIPGGAVAAVPTVVSPASPAVPPTLPVLLPPPAALNGLALDTIIVMPEATRQTVRAIFAAGQTLGRSARAFSKLGDSIIENPHFLARFDGGPYNLGAFAYLQPVVDFYAGSFSRQGVAVRRGLHSWSVFDPMYAAGGCAPGEHMVACELRQNNPSVLFIRLGTNDVGVPESFERNLRQLVDYCFANGVIPVLGTKADRFRDPADTNNTLIRQIAAAYNVPLWDFDRIAATLPNRGLDNDGVHLTTFFAHDYTQADALQRGHGLNNLTALMMLDAILRATVVTNP